MPKKKAKRVPTPEDLRKLSDKIYKLFVRSGQLCSRIPLHALCLQPATQRELMDTINGLLEIARSIERQRSLLFLFERSFRWMHGDVALLDDRFTSYHERAFHTAYSFLMRLLTHELDKLPVPETFYFKIPDNLTQIDLEVASRIAELHRDEFINDGYTAELMMELTTAANLLADADRPIPAEYRTKAMSKQQAAAYLGHANPDSGVRWLNQCIQDGTIRCEQLSRQSYVFDMRQFPAKFQAVIVPAQG